ncbi:MAG: hypothetical protein AAF721_38655, partial [Myxococcota bacterium]
DVGGGHDRAHGGHESPHEVRQQLLGGGDAHEAEHLDLSQAAGCLVASPKRHTKPVVCVVGYRGGIGQLVEDVGPEHLRSGGADYAALEIQGNNVFAATVGTQLALSLDPELIAATRPMLESHLVGTPPGANQDFVATAFPNVIWADAEEEIEGFFGMMQGLSSPGTGNPGLDTYMSGSVEASLSIYRSLAELSAMQLSFDIGDRATELGYRGVALPETPTAKSYAKAKAAGSLDAALLAMLPSNSVFSVAMNFDMKDMLEEPMFKPYLKLLRDVDDATQNTNFLSWFEQSFEVWAELLAGPGAMALITPAKGRWALDYVYTVRDGVDSRPRLRKLFQTMTPNQVGPDFGRYVQWRVRPDAFKVGKTKVDVLTLKPTPAAMSKLRGLPGMNGLVKMLGAKPAFNVAFTQVDQRLLMVTTPGPAKEHMKTLVASVAKPTPPPTDVQASLRNNPEASALGFFDVDAIFDWARSLNGAARLPTLRTEPGDVVFSSRMANTDTREYRFSVAHTLTEQLVSP